MSDSSNGRDINLTDAQIAHRNAVEGQPAAASKPPERTHDLDTSSMRGYYSNGQPVPTR